MSSPSSASIQTTRAIALNGAVHSSTRGSFDQQDLTLEDAMSRLEIENRLKEGAENLLQVLDTRTRERPRDVREARRLQVMEELNQINARIGLLNSRITDLTANSGNVKVYRRQRSEEKLGSRPKLATIKSYSSTERSFDTSSEQSPWSIKDVVVALSQPDQDAPYYIAQANALTHLLQRHNSVSYDLCNPTMATCLIRFLSSPTTNVVAAGYRMARHMVQDARTASFVLSTGLERCMINSLAKDHRYTLEKEQAIKLLRALYVINSEHVLAGVIRALISIAEGQDRLASICLQTLSEMILVHPRMMADHGGYRCVIDSLIEGSSSLSDEIVMVLIHDLDNPATRCNLRAGRDLEVIFSPFTECLEGKRRAVDDNRLITSATVVCRMLDSWPGLLGLSMYNFRGIKSIVDVLRVPASTIRDSVLDLIFSLLSIPVNNMSSIFLAGRRLTTLGRIPISAETSGSKPIKVTRVQTSSINLLRQFSAMKLLLFLDVGLLDALMVVVEDKADQTAGRKATLLVGEILQRANALLPLAKCRTLQSLPRLFCSAVDLWADRRLSATSALFQIESLNRTKNKTSMARIVNSADQLSSKRGQRQVEQVKIKMGLQIDDSHFRNLLLDTQVLSTKNYTKWHWDTLTELVQGPLLNPRRLEESIRATKFMKRLLAFYRPFTHRFSAIRNTKPNQKYVKFGCLLLNTLLANPEGVKYLTESKLLRQLSECLAQMDPMNHVTASDALFSKNRLEDTLCHGYFDLIGVLTTHAQGIAMMERWRMFSSLYHLTDLRSRGDLVRLFLTRLDYSYEGHPRIIMSKALTTSLFDVRLFATEHLSTLIVEPHERTKKTADWAIRLLVTQLYDPNTEVCQAAVRVLEEACNSQEHLEHIVELRPALDHLGDIGGPLLLRFLATSVGFHYLKELNYIDQEMDDWFHGRNDEYVVQVEAALLIANAPLQTAEARSSTNPTPAHFYGELAKTEEGVTLLLAKGHFTRYVDVLRQYWMEEKDASVIHKVKAALWAIGSIGATERGAPFLQNSHVMLPIVNIATRSQIATLKGTACLVLGMISTTMVGVNLLKEHKWNSVLTNMGVPIGICVPEQIGDVLNLQPWPDRLGVHESDSMPHPVHDPLTSEIMRSMSDLGNHILANDAAKSLVRLRQKYPDKFMDPSIYDRVFDLLANYNFKLEIRRFLLELFSTSNLQSYMLRRIHVTVRPHRGYSLPKDLTGGAKESDVADRREGGRNPQEATLKGKVRAHRSATVGT